MFTADPRALAATLDTITRVQNITGWDDVVTLAADTTGTVTATHQRTDGGRFAIAVPAATGTGDPIAVGLRALQAALTADPDAERAILPSVVVGGVQRRVRLTCGTTTADLVDTAPVEHSPSPELTGPTIDLDAAALATLARVAEAASPDEKPVDVVALWQYDGHLQVAATNRYVLTIDRIDTEAPARAGNPDSPVLIAPATLTALAALPGPAALTISDAPSAHPAHLRWGSGHYRISGPTWTLERSSVDAEYFNVGWLIDRERCEITGSVTVDVDELRRAATAADAGIGGIAVQYVTAPTGETQLLLSSAAGDSCYCAAVDAHAVHAENTAAPSLDRYDNSRMILHPGNLRALVAGLTGTVALAWGHPAVNANLPRLWLDHDNGCGVLTSISR